jgi:hypothetical protein
MDFKSLLSSAGRAFIGAFAVSALALSTGVLSAPNLDAALALGVAALFASVAAGIKVLQEFVPQLSFGNYLAQPFGAYLDAFLQAGLGAFLITAVAVLNAPDLSSAKSLALAGLVGALMAGFRALQGLATPGETPAPGLGLGGNGE